MRKRKGLRAQMRDWNHASREIAKAAQDAKNGEKSTVTLYGRRFSVLSFRCDSDANRFMEKTPGYGVLHVSVCGLVSVARLDDEGATLKMEG